VDEIQTFNRREHERFTLAAMYTSVEAMRNAREAEEPLTGHAYDISEGGARIELDEPLPEGEPVHLRFTLPGETKQIRANANVVRVLSEEDDPGPRRMGLRFIDFATQSDRDRLLKFLGSGAMRIAA
jgi:c-di-GMP-binding flagellar brake protein YcgR